MLQLWMLWVRTLCWELCSHLKKISGSGLDVGMDRRRRVAVVNGAEPSVQPSDIRGLTGPPGLKVPKNGRVFTSMVDSCGLLHSGP